MAKQLQAQPYKQAAAKASALPAVFRQIAQAAERVDTLAAGILRAIQDSGVTDLAGFDSMVAEAYQKNGWSQRIGRPQPGDVPAPSAIRVYVSTVRGGYRLGLDPARFSSMEELRKASRAQRLAAREAEPKRRRFADHPKTAGEAGALYRALWSDILAVREALPDVDQHRLDDALRKALAQFAKRAPADVQAHLQLVA